MLAGLIFATEEAEDRPDVLAATLPFGGMTLLEYQVRLLVGAGAGQVLVAVARVTPALLGAVARAGKRGVPVDVVRSAEEAAARVHPLARVLVMADGLVTIDPAIDRMAIEGPERILVTPDGESPAAVERLDAADFWAGMAHVPAQRLAEIAEMPDDYDFQSALLRASVQARAERVHVTAGWERGGHAVEHSAAALASRGNAVLAALTERRTTWADRWIFTRIARLGLPWMVEHGVPGWALAAAGGVLALLALMGIGWGWTGLGFVGALVAVSVLVAGSVLGLLRGEEKRAEVLEGAMAVFVAASVLLAGWVETQAKGTATALVLAIALAGMAAIAERAPVLPRRWWASPAAYLLLLTPFALSGYLLIGLGLLAAYALVTLAAAVEDSREKA